MKLLCDNLCGFYVCFGYVTWEQRKIFHALQNPDITDCCDVTMCEGLYVLRALVNTQTIRNFFLNAVFVI